MATITGIKAMVGQLKRIVEEDYLKEIYFRKRAEIREITINTIRYQLRQHYTYEKLTSGALNKHFGFYPGEEQTRPEAIVNAIANDVIVAYNTPLRTIMIEVIIDKQFLYELKEAYVVNDSSNIEIGRTPSQPETVFINWLQWLLDGNTIQGYRLKLKDDGRSREAIMIQGGNWSVPPDVAGTEESNWITESFESAGSSLSFNLKRFILNA